MNVDQTNPNAFKPQGEPLYCPACGGHLAEVEKRPDGRFLIRCHYDWYEVRGVCVSPEPPLHGSVLGSTCPACGTLGAKMDSHPESYVYVCQDAACTVSTFLR
jgi:hypothetical protein